MTTPRIRSRRGFTLVELLTVVAILAILVAILVPTLGSVRARAAQVKSQANLRSLSAAMLLYAGDNKNYLPWVMNGPEGSWDWAIRSYVNATNYGGTGWENLFFHPRDPAPVPTGGNAGKPRRTYSMNGAESGTGSNKVGVGPGSKMANVRSYRINAIANPSRVILLAERPNSSASFVGVATWSDVMSASQVTGMMTGLPNLNPGGKYDFAFCDGHVEALLPQDTLGTGTDPSVPTGMWTVTNGN